MSVGRSRVILNEIIVQNLQIQDEGVDIGDSRPSTINFTGDVDVSRSGNVVTVDVTGGGGGGSGTVTSVSGVTNRTTITGTPTVTPTVDISASYVGQSSITTLGTISTGVWGGTAIAVDKGGTSFTSYAVGDLIQASASTTLAKLASVSAGSFLRAAGVTTVSAWSTVKLPDTMSALGIWVANSANTTVNLTAAAGESIRVNAGGTAWEAYTPSASGITGSLTNTRVVFATGTSTVSDDANFTFNSTTDALTVNGITLQKANGAGGFDGLFLGNGAGVSTVFVNGGRGNLGIGKSVLSSLVDGASVFDAGSNTAVGNNAMRLNTTGFQNSAFGYGALEKNTTGTQSTAFGNNALGENIGTGANTAFGYNALKGAVGSTGTENTAFGRSALQSLTTGVRNVAVGPNLQNVTTGSYNNAIGSESFEAISTQSYNTGLGHLTGVYWLGTGNTFIGGNAGGQVTNPATSGDGNTFIGLSSGVTENALNYSYQGSNNTYLGTESGLGSTTQVSYSTAVGSRAKVYSSRSMVFGGEVGNYIVNYGFGGEGYGSGFGVIYVKNAATNASSAGANGIIIHAKDSSDGSANSTLALYLEQVPEATATFTQTHRVKIWINGVEYWWSLDAV